MILCGFFCHERNTTSSKTGLFESGKFKLRTDHEICFPCTMFLKILTFLIPYDAGPNFDNSEPSF